MSDKYEAAPNANAGPSNEASLYSQSPFTIGIRRYEERIEKFMQDVHVYTKDDLLIKKAVSTHQGSLECMSR
jgi:hypothetical protein